MISIADLPDDPKYTIKTVSALTGIRPVTIRAWERRYNLLSPKRAENRYRRYSEREVALLQWVRNRVESGVSISSAAREINDLISQDRWPETVANFTAVPIPAKARPPQEYATELLAALLDHNETAAEEILRSAQASLDLPSLFLQVIAPCLVEIGEAWYRGEIRVVTEHFASNLLRARLGSLMQALPTRRNAPLILSGCAPNELHEIGSLMVSILLRQAGFRVEYLGQDVPSDDLVSYAKEVKPAMVCLSAMSKETAQELLDVQRKLAKQVPQTIFGYGGQAFIHNPGLRNQTPGIFLGDNAVETVKTIRQLLKPGTTR